MPKHPRQVIREAIAAALRFKTVAQERVHAKRRVPWALKDLPGISVGTPDEESEPANLDGDLDRKVTVVVSGVLSTQELEDLDAALDNLALEIEEAMGADPTFGGAATGCTLRTTGEEDEPTGKPMAAKVLTFEVEYQTAAPG